MSMKNWSTTAGSNATVDSINFAEGQTPSSLNDSARALMADVRYELATQDTIASATTTDLGSKDAGSLTISGTTTITGFGTVSAGIRKLVTHSGALTLTHNGTSLILPGAANITTVAGDSYIAESLGSGNWKVHSYQKATQTGSGANVNATSPTLVTPTLGDATATTINKVTITAPASSATITIANGKTLTANNSITLAGTDSTTITFPSTSCTVARTDAANTFTGVQTLSNQPILSSLTASQAVFTDASKGLVSNAISGSGNVAMTTSPVFTTPTLGVASATSINFGQTALSYYGEGTWTPALGGSTTYNTQIGLYTRVGRLIDCTADIAVNAIGTGSTTTISNLPFTVNGTQPGRIGTFSTLAVNVLGFWAYGTSTILTFQSLTAANTSPTNQPAIFGSSAAVRCGITYHI